MVLESAILTILLGGIYFSFKNFLNQYACTPKCQDRIDDTKPWLTTLLVLFVLFGLAFFYNSFMIIRSLKSEAATLSLANPPGD
jgi:hypothetical protein